MHAVESEANIVEFIANTVIRASSSARTVLDGSTDSVIGCNADIRTENSPAHIALERYPSAETICLVAFAAHIDPEGGSQVGDRARCAFRDVVCKNRIRTLRHGLKTHGSRSSRKFAALNGRDDAL